MGGENMREEINNINGIELCSALNTNLKSFCLSLYVRAGSIFEDSSNNGITHLFEHVVFRNLKRKFENFYERLAFHGIDLQGCTYKEFLCFTINGPYNEFDFAIDVLCGLFDEIVIKSDNFINEKKRIKAEIRENNQRDTLDYYFQKQVWKGSSAEKTIIGYCKILDNISLKKLNDFRKEIFSKGNCLICVTGNVTEENIDKLKERINGLDIYTAQNVRTNSVAVCDEFFNRSDSVFVKNGYWHYVQIGFDIDTAKYSNGVLDLLYAILFKGEKALFHYYLSEENPIIYSYDGTLEQYDNVGNLYFNFEVSKNKIYEAIMVVSKLFCDVKAGLFNFEANLQSEIYALDMDVDNPNALNFNNAYYNHLLKSAPIDYNDEFYGRFRVTKEEVIEAAKDIFKISNMTVAIKGDKRKIDAEKIEKILRGEKP